MTALAASLGTLALIATTVRRIRPSRAAFAVAAFGMNPVVLFQSVASGHNDLLVALAVAGAFALVLARREMLAVTALTLGALVKVTAGLPLLLLVVWCVARAPAGRRVRTLSPTRAWPQRSAAVFAAPFFNLHDPTLGILELAGHEGWLAPSRFFRRLLDAVSGDTLGGRRPGGVRARAAHGPRRPGASRLALGAAHGGRPHRRAGAGRGVGMGARAPDAARPDPAAVVRGVGAAARVAAPACPAPRPAGHVGRARGIPVDGRAGAVPGRVRRERADRALRRSRRS